MKLFAFSDIHGNMNLFNQIEEFLNQQEETYKCYFLGDACDRGKHGYEIIKGILNHPHMIYLKGNHEDMFVRAAKEYLNICEEEGYDPVDYAVRHNYKFSIYDLMYMGSDLALWCCNGGAPTFKAWIDDGCPRGIINRLNALSKRHTVEWNMDENPIVFDMCHAGCPVDLWDCEDDNVYLWDRTHFNEKWNLYDGRKHLLVHGHTPMNHIDPVCIKWKAHYYMANTKLNLDCATYRTNAITLVELTTAERKYFFEDYDV